VPLLLFLNDLFQIRIKHFPKGRVAFY
jgi:hypothetical protein